VGESLEVHPTARLPGLAVSGSGSLEVGWDLVSESLKVHPTSRLPGLAVGEREPEGTPHSQATQSESWWARA
jgi:hypothetical protein